MWEIRDEDEDVAKILAFVTPLAEQPSDIIRTALKAAGWKRIGTGSFKEAFKHPDFKFIVKVIYHNPGYGSNEIKNYESAPPEVQAMLAPIRAVGKHIQIQRYIEHTNYCPGANCPAYVVGVTDMGLGKNHAHLADGTVVVYDYGQESLFYREPPPEILSKLKQVSQQAVVFDPKQLVFKPTL